MVEKNSSSTNNLQRKFQKWFEDRVPPDLPIPDEPGHSIEELVPPDIPAPTDADRPFEDPIPANLPLSVGANHSYNDTTGVREGDLQKIIELFSFGFSGAIFLGAIVGFILLMMDVNYLGWYSDNWPSQIVVILFAVILGFFGGLFMGFIYKLRERYSYKDEH